MLPASTGERKQRDVSKGRPDGRTVEIQRLIGRSLRGVVDFEALGERTDLHRLRRAAGRRRHALRLDHRRLRRARARRARGCRRRASSRGSPLTGTVAAVSCGVVDGDAAARPRLPGGLDRRGRRERRHDRRGRAVEVQATAERTPLSRAHLDELLALAAARHRGACARRRPGRGGSDRRPMAVRLVLATRNAHKLREFERLLPGVELEPLPDDVELPPGGRRHVRGERADQGPRGGAATGRAAIADDSGIEAAALGGAPGVRSARFAGEHATDEENLAKLPRRGARRAARSRYVCVIAHVAPDGDASTFRGRAAPGTLAGRAARRRRLRLRPGVRARTTARRPHDGRARRRGEGRDLPPRPRRPGAARLARGGLTRAGPRQGARAATSG